jgi:hypothetical protein
VRQSAERLAHQLRAIVPTRAQTYVPWRARGALWPSGGRRPLRPVGCMRGLDGAPQREAANIGHKFRELRLIELVTAIIQNPPNGVR